MQTSSTDLAQIQQTLAATLDKINDLPLDPMLNKAPSMLA